MQWVMRLNVGPGRTVFFLSINETAITSIRRCVDQYDNGADGDGWRDNFDREFAEIFIIKPTQPSPLGTDAIVIYIINQSISKLLNWPIGVAATASRTKLLRMHAADGGRYDEGGTVGTENV